MEKTSLELLDRDLSGDTEDTRVEQTIHAYILLYAYLLDIQVIDGCYDIGLLEEKRKKESNACLN